MWLLRSCPNNVHEKLIIISFQEWVDTNARFFAATILEGWESTILMVGHFSSTSSFTPISAGQPFRSLTQ